MYDDDSRCRVSEKGDYERWVIRECLERLNVERGVQGPLTLIITDTSRLIQCQVSDHIGSTQAADVVRRLTPLIFASAFKLLDLLIEWALDEHGYSGKPFLSFREKVRRTDSGAILTWPSLIGADAGIARCVVSTYAPVRYKRNAIVHGRFGVVRAGNLLFDFEYLDEQSGTRKRDSDVVTHYTTSCFCEFASLLFQCAVEKGHYQPIDVTTALHLAGGFQQLHGLSTVPPIDAPRFFRVIRRTERDHIDIDDVINYSLKPRLGSGTPPQRPSRRPRTASRAWWTVTGASSFSTAHRKRDFSRDTCLLR